MPETAKKKVRNYSFQNSRRLPSDKMTEINGIKIPSMPGSCYHAIICALAENKNKFCSWDKVIQLTEQYMKKYGGVQAWEKFTSKGGVKGYKQRIKDNTHTLTRTGKDCYGYRLHERGMCIYFFKDGVILHTGGSLDVGSNGTYNVEFPDGLSLQTRYRGTTMTYAEYKKFLERNYIDVTGKILDHESIKDYRAGLQDGGAETTVSPTEKATSVEVCVTLSETFDQDTANRLESLGFVVEQALETELVGSAPADRVGDLQSDPDVLDVVVMDAE